MKILIARPVGSEPTNIGELDYKRCFVDYDFIAHSLRMHAPEDRLRAKIAPAATPFAVLGAIFFFENINCLSVWILAASREANPELATAGAMGAQGFLQSWIKVKKCCYRGVGIDVDGNKAIGGRAEQYSEVTTVFDSFLERKL